MRAVFGVLCTAVLVFAATAAAAAPRCESLFVSQESLAPKRELGPKDLVFNVVSVFDISVY